jgi:hypothetical protein
MLLRRKQGTTMIPFDMAKDIIRFMVRLTPEMHAALKEVAEQEDRSLHAQVIHILKQWLQSRSQ